MNKDEITPSILGYLISMGKFRVTAELDKALTYKALEHAPDTQIERFIHNCFRKDKWITLGHTISMRFKKPLDIKTWDEWSQEHYLDGVDAPFIRKKLEALSSL